MLDHRVPARYIAGMKHKAHIEVSCAIIEHAERVLAVQRSARMSNPLKWEFPGGKIEPGENPEQCLKREILEELGLHVTLKLALKRTTHAYDAFSINLYPFTCRIESGCLTLNEHRAFRWLTAERLHLLDWADADRPVLENYLKGESDDG